MSQPILIQGAMDCEVAVLVSALRRPESITLGGFQFWAGTYKGWELVVCRTEMGMTLSAAATALGIARFHPRLVLNQGTAGAHLEELTVGDIVVGRQAVCIHDLRMPPRDKGDGMAPEAWTFSSASVPLPADPAWIARLEAASYRGGKKLCGLLGSGDLFSREYDRILWLRTRLGTLCEDMESAAVYQVCRRMETPVVGVRIISNNELTGAPFQEETAGTLQRFLLDVFYGA